MSATPNKLRLVSDGGSGPNVFSARRADQKTPALREPFKRGDVWGQRSFQVSTGGGSHAFTQMFAALGGNETLTHPYLESPWVNACIRAIERAILKPGHAFMDGPDKDAEPIESGSRELAALQEVLRKPNPVLSWRMLLGLTCTYDQLDGESLWLLAKRSGGTFEPVDALGGGAGPGAQIETPDFVMPVMGSAVGLALDKNTKMPSTWKFSTGEGKQWEWPAHAVFHPYHPDPQNYLRGVGPMQAALRAASQNFDAERFDDSLLKRGGMPGGYFKTKNPLNKEQKDEIGRRYMMNFGRPSQDRKPMTLTGDLDFHPAQQSARDMELGELRKWNRNTIMSVLGVPGPIIARTDEIARNVAEAAQKAFWETTVGPWLDWFEDVFNMGFVQRLPGLESVYFRFDRSSIPWLQPDIESAVESVERLVGLGRSFNEAAAIANLRVPTAIENGDEHWIASNLVPVDVARTAPRGSDGRADGRSLDESGGCPIHGKAEGEADADDGESPELSEAERKFLETLTPDVQRAMVDAEEKRLKPLDARLAKRVRGVQSEWLKQAKSRVNRHVRRGLELLTSVDELAEGVELQVKRDEASIEKQLDRILRQGLADTERAFATAVASATNATWDESAKAVARSAGAEGFLRHNTEEALRYLRRYRVQLAEQTMGTLVDDVRLALMQAMSEGGATTGTLAKRLEKVLTEANASINHLAGGLEARALRIAQTTNTAVSGRARVDEMRRDDITKHVWITEPTNARDTHKRLNKRVRKVGSEFGFKLHYPGDNQHGATAGNIVNCRCTTAAIPSE